MDEENQDATRYAINGKIMLASIVILFVVCFVVASFHVYARCWFRHRPVRHLHLHRRRRRRVNTVATISTSRGLDLCVMNSLPTFIYESKNQESPLECSVCMSDFEDGETGRVLPECKHCFHVDCIDMWLQSHCDCPLCRAQVKVQAIENPVQPIENPDERIIITIVGSEGTGHGSGSELDFTCQCDGTHMGFSTSSPAPEDPGQLIGQTTGQDPTKYEGTSDSGRNIGSDIESGLRTKIGSIRVLKRLF